MLLGIIILIIIVLLIVFAVDELSGGYGIAICGLVFSAVVVFGYLYLKISGNRSYKADLIAKKEFAKEEQEFLIDNNIRGREFTFREYIKFIVTPTQFYVRSVKEQVGKIYERGDIKKVYAVPTTRSETQHYEDSWGAAKMGAVAGVASWFGIGTIADLNSLDNLSYDVLKTFVSITVCIEMKDGNKLSYCLMSNENVDDSSGARLTGEATQIGFLINTLKQKPSKKTKLNSIALNSFIPFDEEDKEAGKRLLPYAKGLPVDNGTHWYCACGTLNDEKTDKCSLCENAKETVFEKVTKENLESKKEEIKEQLRIEEEVRKKREKTLSYKIDKIKNKIKQMDKTSLILVGMALGAAIFTRISLRFHMYFDSDTEWLLEYVRVILIIIKAISIVFIVVEVIGLLFFKEQVRQKAELALIISCLAINIFYTILGIIVACLARDMNYTFFAVIINLPFTVAYFICRKKFSKINDSTAETKKF